MKTFGRLGRWLASYAARETAVPAARMLHKAAVCAILVIGVSACAGSPPSGRNYGYAGYDHAPSPFGGYSSGPYAFGYGGTVFRYGNPLYDPFYGRSIHDYPRYGHRFYGNGDDWDDRHPGAKRRFKERWRDLSDDERARIKARWKDLEPDERARIRARHRSDEGERFWRSDRFGAGGALDGIPGASRRAERRDRLRERGFDGGRGRHYDDAGAPAFLQEERTPPRH